MHKKVVKATLTDAKGGEIMSVACVHSSRTSLVKRSRTQFFHPDYKHGLLVICVIVIEPLKGFVSNLIEYTLINIHKWLSAL